jgi:hypothetical protein
METKNIPTRILAISGTVLVGLPVLAPIVFGVIHWFAAGRFLVDYLMPAELFPVVLVGGLLLVWASLRARLQQWLIGGALGASVLLLVGSQALAMVTGLDSAEGEEGVWFVLVMGLLALFDGAVIAVGVGGALLLRDLFGTKGRPS